MANKFYIANVGLSYATGTSKKETHHEAGSILHDIPETSISWLLEQGLITETKPPKTKEDKD